MTINKYEGWKNRSYGYIIGIDDFRDGSLQVDDKNQIVVMKVGTRNGVKAKTHRNE